MTVGPERALIRALGEELRSARESAGLREAEIVARLGAPLTEGSYAAYERGARLCSTARFVEVCRLLGQEAGQVLSRAVQRSRGDLYELEVDASRVIADQRGGVGLRRWAERRVRGREGEPAVVVRLGVEEIRDFAALLGTTAEELYGYFLALDVSEPEVSAAGIPGRGVPIAEVDKAINRALGVEVRRARTDAGITRIEMSEQMEVPVCFQSLAAYEHGRRGCPITRLVEICRVLEQDAGAMLRRAVRRAMEELRARASTSGTGGIDDR